MMGVGHIADGWGGSKDLRGLSLQLQGISAKVSTLIENDNLGYLVALQPIMRLQSTLLFNNPN